MKTITSLNLVNIITCVLTILIHYVGCQAFNSKLAAHTVKNVLKSSNLTIIMNCFGNDSNRHEAAVNTFIKFLDIPYRLVQVHNEDFDEYVRDQLLKKLTSSGDEWFDIMMLCWDDGRNNGNRSTVLTDLLEIIDDNIILFGNVRWIFWAHEHILKKIQQKCGVIYVNVGGGTVDIYSEDINLILQCGGRFIFIDSTKKLSNMMLLRNRSTIDEEIFEHEVKLSRLKSVRILCGTTPRPQRQLSDYCTYPTQKELLSGLSRYAKLDFMLSKQYDFGDIVKGQENQTIPRFNGAIGELQNRTFDVCAINVHPTDAVSNAITFAQSYYRYDYLTIFSPKAQRIIGQLKLIFMPFDKVVWFYVMLSIAMTTVMSTLFTKYQNDDFHFMNHLFNYIFPFTGRVPEVPMHYLNFWSFKVLIAFWVMYSYFLNLSYAGILTSFRNRPPQTAQIDRLTQLIQLLKENKIDVSVVNDSKYTAILQSPVDVINTIGQAAKQKNASSYCGRPLECIYKVLNRTHVFISTDYSVKWEVGVGDVAIHRGKDNINEARLSLALQKGSPIQGQVKDITRSLFDTGILQRAASIEDLDADRNAKVNKTVPIPPYSVITFSDSSGTFRLLVLGLLLSTAVAFMEICIKRLVGGVKYLKRLSGRAKVYHHRRKSVACQRPSWSRSTASTSAPSSIYSRSQSRWGDPPGTALNSLLTDTLVRSFHFEPWEGYARDEYPYDAKQRKRPRSRVIVYSERKASPHVIMM